MTCTHWSDGGYCGADPTRLYLIGQRCAAHTPAAVAGIPEATPDPTRTLVALRQAAGIPIDSAPPLPSSGLMDERAVASGKRRSNARTYRAARAAEDARRSR